MPAGAVEKKKELASERWGVSPFFIVDNVVKTANFYQDKLGFRYDRFWGEPECFCMVSRGGLVLMLSQLPKTGLMRPNHKADPNNEAWDAYITVQDADALRAEFEGRGVRIVRDICDQPYMMRDFDIEDCNGYRLCFGHDISKK